MKQKSKDLSKGVPSSEEVNQSSSYDPSPEDTNQSRKLGMALQSSDFDRIDQDNPFVGMASNPCGSKPK